MPLAARVPASLGATFTSIDYFVWAVFVAEYLIKLYLSPSRWGYVRRHPIDLILASALRRTRSVLTHQGLHFALLSVMGIILVCSAMELAFERHAPGATIHNFADALWWATVTVTTVGYGDTYPVTDGGRGVAVVLMLTGIGLVGVLSASVASYFVSQRAEADMTDLHRRLDRIEDMLARALDPERLDDLG